MIRTIAATLAALLLPAAVGTAPAPSDVPTYTAAGEMNLPADYRQWVFLSSGLDINYLSATPADPGKSVFQNVFVNPTAYQAFLATGTWPEKTTLVLEIRTAAPKADIDRRGQTQAALRAIEIHVKDSAHIHQPGGWAFFEFGTAKTAQITPTDANCYSCHQQHGVVDTTFVQYYPTIVAPPDAAAHPAPASKP
jgi:hypothetical protein